MSEDIPPAGWALRDAETIRTAAAASQPDLPAPTMAFVHHVATLVRGGGLAAARRLPLGEVYLAYRCGEGDSLAIKRFEQDYGAPIAMAVRRCQSTKHSEDDLRQIILGRLFSGETPRIRAYTGKGSLGAWTGVVALRIALNAVRGKTRDVPVAEAERTVKVDALPDPELEYLRRKYRVDFEAAFAAAVADLAPRERSLLRQHLVERLSGEDLARLHGVDSGTISRRLGRAREHVAEQTCSRLRATLDISAAELDSILVVIRSRLDLSITRVFAEAG